MRKSRDEKWGLLQPVTWFMRKSKPAKFTQQEYDAFFDSPVWKALMQVVATDISLSYSFLVGDVGPQAGETVDFHRGRISALAWFTHSRKLMEDRIEEDSRVDRKTRDAIDRVLDILEEISKDSKNDKDFDDE